MFLRSRVDGILGGLIVALGAIALAGLLTDFVSVEEVAIVLCLQLAVGVIAIARRLLSEVGPVDYFAVAKDVTVGGVILGAIIIGAGTLEWFRASTPPQYLPAPVTVQEFHKLGRSGGSLSLRLDEWAHLPKWGDTQVDTGQETLGKLFQDYVAKTKPAIFSPWPPPAASARIELPRLLFSSSATLGALGANIVSALNAAGYFEYSFYYVPYGFALVTRMEQISDDGTPASSELRWKIETPAGMRSLSIEEYLRVLFTAPVGRYRVIVFVVTPSIFKMKNTTISRNQAQLWLMSGDSRLDNIYNQIPFLESYQVYALIYEFIKQGTEAKAVFLNPSDVSAIQQFIKSKLWSADLLRMSGGK